MHPSTPYTDANFIVHSQLHERPTTIHHWQLRDLICSTEKREEFYTVYDSQTLLYNVKTTETTVVQDLPFLPHCMTYRHGFLAAGGPRSELEVKNVQDGSVVYKAEIGGSVNNAMHITKDLLGRPQLFVCNNDRTIKVFQLPSAGQHNMQLTTTIRTDVAMNYVAASPDSRFIVCVGDNLHIEVYEATPTGYRHHSAFIEANDHGMCCAWSPYGSCIAAAAQDGTVCVLDFNSGDVVAKYRRREACRNVKFSSGPMDLMAFTEHKSRCHVVDARRWDKLQTLNSGECDNGISGCTFTPEGTVLYVALDGHVMAYEVDVGARRCFGAGELR